MSKEQFSFIFNFSHEIRNWFHAIDHAVATYIACQSALETAYGTSVICRQNRNYFGMKLPKVRVTTALQENRGHAVYADISCSIVDYFIWMEMAGFTSAALFDLSVFRSCLENSNFNPKRKEYVSKIDSIYENYKSLYEQSVYF